MLTEPSPTQGDLNFRIFGIPVRVHPFFWVVTVLLGLSGTRGEPFAMLLWVVAVFISILLHELGHAFAARANGWEPWITLYGMGGLASYQPTREDPVSRIFISFAGPLAGFALAALMIVLLRATGHDFTMSLGGPLGIRWYLGEMDNVRLQEFVHFMMFINIFWGLVNLLPIYPLDGGQISRQLFNLFGGRDSLRDSLWLSVFAAAAVAIYSAFSLKDNYLALMFGYLAYTNYSMLQGYYGSGGRTLEVSEAMIKSRRKEPHGTNGEPPRRRVVLLGASNLARGISTVVETARRIWGRPLDVLTALGHGRSYGKNSTVICRELPGITECGLWDALNRSTPVPTAALVTDIGNDLLYDAQPPEIAAWVEQCLDRLAAAGARTVVTLLPVGNLTTLSDWRFRLIRNVSFPNCRLTLDTVRGRAFELNDLVRELAVRRGIPIVEQRTEWYGFDPIHIKLGRSGGAWRDVLAGWSDTVERAQPARASLARSLYLLSHAPERRRLLGFEQRKKQPAARLSDGTTVAIY